MGTLLQFKPSTINTDIVDYGEDAPVVSINKKKLAELAEQRDAVFAEGTDAPQKIRIKDPTDWRALCDAGEALHTAGDPRQALRHYELALLHSDQPVLYFNAAVALGDLGDADGAIAYYRRCLKEDETYADAHFNLAQQLATQGEGGAAWEHSQRYDELTGGKL